MDRKLSKIILLAPISLLYVLLIGGGFFVVIKESFGYIPNLGFEEWTFEYFHIALRQSDVLYSLVLSLVIATVSAFVSIALGSVFAFKMITSQSETVKKIAHLLNRFGMILPYLYMVFLVMLMFSQSGLLSRVIGTLLNHESNKFPNLIYGMGGVILVFVLKGIPFVTMLVYNVMSKISDDYDQIAKTLGSSKWTCFRKIHMPLSKDTIVWTGMVLFAYDLGAFEVPYILSQIRQQSFAVRIYSAYLSPKIENMPVTMAMAIILFVVGLASVVLFAVIVRNIIGRLK